MKKILFITFTLDLGGGQILLKNLVKGLKSEKNFPIIWSPCNGTLEKDYKDLRVPVYINDFEIDRINRDKTIFISESSKNKINKIIKTAREKKEKVAIRCAGSFTNKLLNEFNFDNIDIVGIFDNNPALIGTQIKNINVYPVNEIKNFEIDSIIIAHLKPNFIKNELKKFKINNIYDISNQSINKNIIKFLRYFYNLFKPLAFFANINADIFYINNANNFWAVFIGKLLKKKVIWAIHEGFEPQTFRVYPQFLYFLSFKLADKFIFPSKATYEYYKDYIDKDKVNIIYNGIEIEKIEKFKEIDSPEKTRLELNIPVNNKVILNVAVFNEIKGLEYFVKASINILNNSQTKDFTFVLVGKNESQYAEHICNLIKESDYSEYFRIIPVTKDVFKYFNIADIYVTSSISETFCISNIEAAAFKKPVISTNVCGIPEAIEDGITGILFPIQNMEKHLSENIIKLLNNPDIIEKFTSYGYERVCKNFTYEIMIQNYLKIFNSL